MQTDVALGLRLARAGVELHSEEGAIRDTFAWALFANDLYDEAVIESERALELTSEADKENYREYLARLRTENAALREPAAQSAGAEDLETKDD